MPGSLIETKFYIPPVRPNLISRPRLIEKLNAGLGNGNLGNGQFDDGYHFPRRLTLVSAPAGFGKTTLITNWIRQLRQFGKGIPIVCGWLSLDEADNEPLRFVTYLTAAVQKADLDENSEFGVELLAGLQSSRPPDEAAVIPALLNELTDLTRPMLLILDDYHTITDPTIHDLLAQLIDYLPPQIQLVITSREDPALPLPRWRVRGQLTEIRAADLRFSSHEAADFLFHTMGLKLTDEVVAQLESRTEGWVAGLQLAALAIQSPISIDGELDTTQLAADFSGSDRHVAGYLLEEVLHRQPEARQRFLLETAVLERFNAAVCDHLTGRGDSRQMLEILDQNNLFVIPLDNQGQWYRYHHLFAQLLRHRLERDETAEVREARHRKARDWFDEQGLMESTIYHGLKAGDLSWVADYLCRFGPASLWEGTKAALFKSWLNQLPQDLIKTSPRLRLLACWAYLITADINRAEQYLLPLESVAELEETLQAEVFLIKAIFARGKGENEGALAWVSKALKILPESQETMRHLAYLQVTSASLNLGQIDKANDVSRFVYDSVDISTTSGLNLYLSAAQMLSIVLRDKAQPFPAMNMLQHTIDVVNERATTSVPMIGLLLAEVARIYYEWNELEKAADFCNQAITLGERTGISDLLFSSYLLDAYLARREGDLNRINQRLTWFRDVTHQGDMGELVTVSEFIEASFKLDIGDLASAVRWANASGLKLTDNPTFNRYGHYHTLIRIYLAEGERLEGDKQQAELLSGVAGLIERLMVVVQEANIDLGIIELLILKAILLNIQDDINSATAVMSQAIALAEPGSLVRTFLDNGPPVYPLIREIALKGIGLQNGGPVYIQSLLQACEAEWGAFRPDQSHLAPSPLVDPLTEREREVLACIVAGLSNREIEERLVISRNTVRTHIKNMYSKLGVNGRKEAVEQAQLVGLS